MHETFADRICRGFENAMCTQPFGPGMVVWTVHGHMFAAYTENGQGLSLRVPSADAGSMAASGAALSPPELSGEGWVLIPWATAPEELRRRIAISYSLVLGDGNGVTPL